MKEEILQLAEEHLKSGGYENLTFTNLAKSLSTTRANIHHHFRNKEGLALGATQRYADEAFARIKIFSVEHSGDFPSFIRAIERFHAEILHEKGATSSCICSQLIRETNVPDELRKIAIRHFKNIQNLFKQMIIDSQERGTLTKDYDADTLAVEAMSLVLGMGQMALVHGDNPHFRGTYERILSNWIENYT